MQDKKGKREADFVLDGTNTTNACNKNVFINEIGGSPTLLLGLQGGEDLYNKYLAAQVMVQTYEKNFK